MANQALGLAAALAEEIGGEVTEKCARLEGFASDLPERLMGLGVFDLLKSLSDDSDPLTDQWPDVLVGCGRHAVGLSIAIKRAAWEEGRRVFTVQCQDPRISPAHFDAVVPPAHDGLRGKNVIPTLGAVNHVTPALLQQGAERWRATFAGLPRPLIAVLIGGASKAYNLDKAAATALASQLSALQTASGCGFAITTSRRTGRENEARLRDALSGPTTYFWDGEGENPYFGMLALADHIFVTADSTNMITEAAASGKPVHILDLPGGSPKFDRFHQSMRVRGIARPYCGKLTDWSYEPLSEATRVAKQLVPRLRAGRVLSGTAKTV